MKRCTPFFLITAFLFVSFPFFAEPGILVPRDVFVGDSAVFTFETNVFARTLLPGSTVTVLPSDFPVSTEVTLTSIQIIQGENVAQVRLGFVPWISGTLQLPSFTVNKIRVTVPPIHISSLVDKTGQTVLEKARSPLLLPGTTFLVWGGIAGFLVTLLILVGAGLKLRRYLEQSRGKASSGRRVRIFLKQLKLLEKQIKKMPTDEWYRAYALCFRTYLSSFCTASSTRFDSLTAKEIMDQLDAKMGTELLANVQAVLSHIDTTRFSGYPFSDSRLDDVQQMRVLVDSLEKEVVTEGEAHV